MTTVLELKEPPNANFIKPAPEFVGETLEQHLRDLIREGADNIEIEKCSFQEIHNIKATLTEHKYGAFFVRIKGLTAHAHFYLVKTPRSLFQK